MSSKYLSKEAILETDDLRKIEVDVSQWWPDPGMVLVSEMSADVRDEFEQYLAEVNRQQRDQSEQYVHVRGPLCAMCIVNEEGNRLFTSGEIERLGRKNGQALDKIFEHTNKLNKIFGTEREDVEKNSEMMGEGSNDGELQSV